MSQAPREVTHAIASCKPTVKRIPADTLWEPCCIIQAHEEDGEEFCDVEIVNDNDIVKKVSKRFVRKFTVSVIKF